MIFGRAQRAGSSKLFFLGLKFQKPAKPPLSESLFPIRTNPPSLSAPSSYRFERTLRNISGNDLENSIVPIVSVFHGRISVLPSQLRQPLANVVAAAKPDIVIVTSNHLPRPTRHTHTFPKSILPRPRFVSFLRVVSKRISETTFYLLVFDLDSAEHEFDAITRFGCKAKIYKLYWSNYGVQFYRTFTRTRLPLWTWLIDVEMLQHWLWLLFAAFIQGGPFKWDRLIVNIFPNCV